MGPILNSSRKTGFLGMIIALKSTIGIAETLFKHENFTFLMTYKLSQDHIETFFGAIRSRGGFNNNPSAWQFKTAFKRLLVKTDVRILHNSNCQLLDETRIMTLNDNVQQETEQFLDETIFFPDHDYCRNLDNNLSEYAYDVIIYIAGFVSKSIRKCLQCEICKDQLIGSKPLSK